MPEDGFDPVQAAKDRRSRLYRERGEDALKKIGFYSSPDRIDLGEFEHALIDHLVDLMYAAEVLDVSLDIRVVADTAIQIYEAERD